jgi:2-oxoisovalerate dehydrogenase E1 component alpha subunit
VTTTSQALRAGRPLTMRPTAAESHLLPSRDPVQFLDDDGHRRPDTPPGDYPEPSGEALLRQYTMMVLGRRLDAQCTALTKQGRLAVYPSARGQEACQIGAVLAMRPTDWLFPTYRDTMALFARGVDAVEALTLLRGSWHCGYDPRSTYTAPQCTPLATQTVHAAGLAFGEAQQGRDTVAVAFCGDGATSEGDFHEAVNFAAVFRAPVVFFVQNNRYAISVPLSRQTAAPSLAYKGIGYGVASEQVDGNDSVAVLAVLGKAIEHARSGNGPFLVEAHTYRIEPHTNADDASRYRDEAEVDAWLSRDPIARLETHLRDLGALDDDAIAAARSAAESAAATLRERMSAEPEIDPMSLFSDVYAALPKTLREQRDMVLAELAASHLEAAAE